MIRPFWLIQAMLSVQTSFSRNRGNFFLDGLPIVLEFIGTSQIAVVQSKCKNPKEEERDYVPSDVVWVKKVGEDGKKILDIQLFEEGVLSALRCMILVQATEDGKAATLDKVANELPKNLVDYLNGREDQMPWALAPHFALLDALSETTDTRFARKHLRRLLTVHDESGPFKGRRKNLPSRTFGIESTIGRIIKMSKARQRTAGVAAIAAAHLGEVVRAYETFFVNVRAFIDSKLKANTWDKGKRRHRTWLSSFSARLFVWSGEFRKIDVYPFAGDCKKIEGLLIAASGSINAVLERNKQDEEFSEASFALNEILRALDRMLSRLEMARVLRMVSLAADKRVTKFNVKIATPNWVEALSIAQTAAHRWKYNEEKASDLAHAIATHDPEAAYRAIKAMVRSYDNASRAAA